MDKYFPLTFKIMLNRANWYELSQGNQAIFKIVKQHEEYHQMMVPQLKPKYLNQKELL